ncbi:hypothetical protein HGA34_04205 [Candidatus Falkowbacteria bacterium]|nr:hypothetical protein [Candidatus Falkowbacteria bacterium]
MANLAIKVGSNLLVDASSGREEVNFSFIHDLTRQIAELRQQGHRVLLVTSGAVASDSEDRRSKNLRASVGQLRLMSVYSHCFREHGVKDVGQILVTDHDFRHPEIFSATVFEAFDEGVQLVINANDPVNNQELKNMEKCEDNDRLTATAASTLKLDFVLFGIDRPGLMKSEHEVVRRVTLSERETVLGYANGGSQYGHGAEGMRTKLEQIFKLVHSNINAMLLPAHEKDAFLQATAQMLGKPVPELGTIFLPH